MKSLETILRFDDRAEKKYTRNGAMYIETHNGL